MPKTDKSTYEEVQRRVDEVLRLRLAGAEIWDLKEHARQQGWGISTSTLYRYVRFADDAFEKHLEKNRDRIISRHIAQRRALVARAMSVSDYRTVLAILKDEADLLGLYPAKIPAAAHLTDEQLLAEITRLLGQAGAGAAVPPAEGARGEGEEAGDKPPANGDPA